MPSETEWPVQLYRYTESDGWQKQVGGGTTARSTIGAAPRKDCIVIPTLRQKFSLLSNDGDKSCIVRRGQSLLLVSRRRTRAMVLRFPTEKDCLEFSDRFVELNPPRSAEEAQAKVPNNSTVQSTVAGASQDQQEEVVSYLARLLHDDNFLGLVHKLESYLKNTTDGAKILQGLQEQELGRGGVRNHNACLGGT